MLASENEAYVDLLCVHLALMTKRLRSMPDELWDWAPNQAAPTARLLASHTWQWLVCDRQHIFEPDALKHHDIPEVPASPSEICDLLEEETERWRSLILALTSEQFDEPRYQFNRSALDIRSFVCHMIQNSIYKNGQLATLYFALGLDGSELYSAAFPYQFYDEIREMAHNKSVTS